MSKKRRNKQYRPKPVRPPMIVDAALVFGPIQAVIGQTKREGTVTTNRVGTLMFRDGDGRWYCTATAIQGVVDGDLPCDT